MISFLTELLIVFEDKGDSHIDLVGCDLIVLNYDVHVLDPGALDVAQGAGGTLDALVNRILKVLI